MRLRAVLTYPSAQGRAVALLSASAWPLQSRREGGPYVYSVRAFEARPGGCCQWVPTLGDSDLNFFLDFS